jgi:UDP-N-acetylglucosamine--N-acetylmuramyl-(pentapeptide) pyrophosphoryl-undecaprenol N-acetylglucosamine transferase
MSQKNKQQLNIVIVAGGTGGHIYPGLALAEAFHWRYPDCRLSFYGGEGGLEEKIIKRAGFSLRTIKARPLIRKISWRSLTAPFSWLIAFGQAWSALRHDQPDLIVATGGYVSLAVGLAAWGQKIPFFIHEQNALPGATNRWLAKLARKVFLSYPESTAYLSGEVVGNPVRREILEAERKKSREILGLPQEKELLLVMGGSQGARRLNQIVTESLPLLADAGVEVLHLIGERDYQQGEADRFLAAYPFYHPYAYAHHMATILAAVDIVISRAGATGLAECFCRSLPLILIPFPYAAGNHQQLNADAAVAGGAALSLKESALTSHTLISALQAVRKNRPAMAVASGRMSRPDAGKLIVEKIEQCLKL